MLRIIRLPNLLLSFVAVLVGGWIGIGLKIDSNLIIGAIAGAFVAAFGNVANDIIDLPIDRINNPNRPLPSGAISITTAWILTILFLITPLVITFHLGVLPFAIVVLGSFLLYVYSRWLKLTPLANVTVAVIASLTFILGGVIMNNRFSLFLFPISVTYHFARELIKDIIDIEGDRLFGSKSIPIIVGSESARVIAISVIILFTILSFLPYSYGVVGSYYLYIIMILIPINIYIIMIIIQNLLMAASRVMKWVMFIALLAVITGSPP